MHHHFPTHKHNSLQWNGCLLCAPLPTWRSGNFLVRKRYSIFFFLSLPFRGSVQYKNKCKYLILKSKVLLSHLSQVKSSFKSWIPSQSQVKSFINVSQVQKYATWIWLESSHVTRVPHLWYILWFECCRITVSNIINTNCKSSILLTEGLY